MYLQSNRFFYKISDFINLDLLNDGVWLGGGALRAALGEGEDVADYDVFFRNNLLAAKTEVDLEGHGFKVIFKCPEGKLTTMKKDDMKIQLITEFFYDSMEHAIDTFDINACRFITDGDVVLTKYSAVRDVLKKQITLHRIDFPNATMKRIGKYINKGYRLTNKCVDTFVDRVYTAGATNEFLDKRFYID